MSSTRALPAMFSSSAPIAVIGLMLSRFGETMREPVTTTSSIDSLCLSCSCAKAGELHEHHRYCAREERKSNGLPH